MRRPRWSAILTVAAVLTALVVAPVVGAAPGASASVQSGARDSATAAGRDFWTFRDADVIAGSARTYLVITYTAGRPISDGVVRIVLPGSQWRTPLRAVTLLSPTDAGVVAVRPLAAFTPTLPEPGIDRGAGCRPLPASPAPLPWTVRTVLGSQVIEVDHVTCAPGQKLYVHIKGVAAPDRVGRHHLPVVASDRRGLPRLSAAAVDVVPTPRVALQVTVPPVVRAGPGVVVRVRAVRPDGSTATGYRGAVALVTEDSIDCTFSPRQTTAFQFTAADAGVALIPVSFGSEAAHRLRAYDVANKAVSGVSAPFEVVAPGPGTACPAPASYH
jgi:hypothetical protein